MYEVPSEKSFRATRRPCFWKPGTAAGAVLKMRQGVVPAVMAAPITSSELLPAGICSPVTCSLGWLWFHPVTTAWPQLTSWALFEYQIVIAPLAPAAEEADWLVPPQAISATSAAIAPQADRQLLPFIVIPFSSPSRKGYDPLRDKPDSGGQQTQASMEVERPPDTRCRGQGQCTRTSLCARGRRIRQTLTPAVKGGVAFGSADTQPPSQTVANGTGLSRRTGTLDLERRD